jgi:hypothetical protein
MTPKTPEVISTFVRTGFYDKKQLMTIFCEEMYEPGELDPDDVSSALDAELERLSIEKKSWPSVTDCDRLDVAFLAINGRGVIALQNAGYTQSDGYDDFIEMYENSPNPDAVLGYCYYHAQDLDRAVRGGGLYLSFGPAKPSDEESQGPIIGRMIQEELERAGLSVSWNGSFKTRISIPEIVWQRR